MAKAQARRRIGYMRVREYRYLIRVELVPITKEEAVRILRGEHSARESKAPSKVEEQW